MSERPSILLYTRLDASRKPHIERLSELGHAVILLDDGGAVPQWAHALVNCTLKVSRRDLAAATRAIDRLCSTDELAIRGVVSFSETGMMFAAQLAEHYRCAFASTNTLRAARDKLLMRRKLDEHGIPSVPHCHCVDEDAAVSFARATGYPLILKPLIAGGKLYTRRVDDEAELRRHFGPCLVGGVEIVRGDPLWDQVYDFGTRPSLLVEKLVGGDTLFSTRLNLPVGEISVEGCVIDGAIHLLGFHDKPLPANGPYFEEVLWSTPTRVPNQYLAQVKARTAEVVRACLIDNSIFHCEFRTLVDGPVLLEVASRMGGGPIFRSIRESSGIDMVELMLRITTRQAIGVDLFEPKRQRPVVTFALFAEPGYLRGVDGLDVVRAHPNVIEAPLYQDIGTEVHRAPHSHHPTLHVMVAGDTFDEVEVIGEWVKRTICFRTTPRGH